MDVTSLYTNIPQEEGIDTVCRAYEIFYRNEPPIPTQLLKRALRLILQENSFQFNGKNCLQTHGTAMGTKMAVAFSQGRNQVYGIRDHSPGIGIIDPGSRVTSHGIRISHFLCVSLRDQGSSFSDT